MSSINCLEFIPYGNAIGWTVLHSIWQIGLISIALRLVLFFVPRTRPNLRYCLLLLSLVVSLIWVGRTFQQERLKIADTSVITTTNAATTAIPNAQIPSTTTVNPGEISPEITRLTETQTASLPLSANTISNYFAPYVSIVALGWLVGVLLLSIFMLFGFVQLHRLRTRAVLDVSEEWQILFKQLQQQMGIFRTVQFAISEKIVEPITFHFLKPVVLVPMGFFSGLTPEQVEVVLLHELAHIRRQDYLVNTLQSIIEILFFYHPAIWWISGKIREEREHCCDDLVLKVRNNPMLYAEALTRLQVFHQPLKFRLAMSLNGKNGVFKKRIFRLFGQYDRPTSFLKSGLLGALLVLAMLTQAFIQSDAKTAVENAFTSTNLELDTAQIEEQTSPDVQVEKAADETETKATITSTTSVEEGEEAAVNSDENFKALMKAIEEKDVEAVKTYLHTDVNIYGMDERGYTPLLLAAFLKHDKIANLLVRRTLEDAGLDPNLSDAATVAEVANLPNIANLAKIDEIGSLYDHEEYEEVGDVDYNPHFHHEDKAHYDDDCKLLIEAVLKENVADVKCLLATLDADCIDPNPNRITVAKKGTRYAFYEPQTPLSAAAYTGNVEIGKLLVAAKVNVNFSATGELSPLMMAADKGHLAFVKYLHFAGANIHAIEKGDGTVLTVAARSGEQEVVAYLLEQGAKINARTIGEGTPISVAARGGHLETVKFLLSRGADINADIRGEGTPLSVAARSGELEVVEYLLAEGANINSDSRGEGTPLSVAARSGHLETVKFLLSKGADINAESTGEGTPLSVAARSGHLEVVKYLLAQGADINASARGEGTPLTVAARSGHTEVVEYLIAKGADTGKDYRGEDSPLSIAARSGQLEVVKRFIQSGADIEANVRGEGTPLSLAARSGHTRVALYLLDSGADLESNTRGEGTPLSLAARSGDKNMVEFLLEQGADIESKTTGEGTPLTLAARSGHLEVVELLLKEGADITSGGKLEETPLAMAMRSGHRDVARYLVSKGAGEDVFSTKGTSKAIPIEELPKGVKMKIDSPIKEQLKISFQFAKQTDLLIEIRSLDNRLIKELSDVNFKGKLETVWEMSEFERRANYLLYVKIDGELWTQKIGDGTDYPWK